MLKLTGYGETARSTLRASSGCNHRYYKGASRPYIIYGVTLQSLTYLYTLINAASIQCHMYIKESARRL